MDWFTDIASHPHPQKRVRALRCHDLAEAEQQLAAVPSPNDLHCQVYALVADEALRRWRMGLLSVPEEDGDR